MANKNFDVGDKSMESNKAGPKSVGLNTPMGSSPILNIKNFDDGGESNDRPPPMITQSDDDDSSDYKDENNDGAFDAELGKIPLKIFACGFCIPQGFSKGTGMYEKTRIWANNSVLFLKRRVDGPKAGHKRLMKC